MGRNQSTIRHTYDFDPKTHRDFGLKPDPKQLALNKAGGVEMEEIERVLGVKFVRWWMNEVKRHRLAYVVGDCFSLPLVKELWKIYNDEKPTERCPECKSLRDIKVKCPKHR